MIHARGYTLIEVLIALVLVSIALLGTASLQVRAQQAQIEAYQRAQALTLLHDMVDRIALNRQARGCYETSDTSGAYTLGTDTDSIPSCNGAFGNPATSKLADDDMAAWDALLDGASESLDGTDVGGLVGARGCVSRDLVLDEITVAVAWQGEVATGVAGNKCGDGLYGDENLRRAVAETITFADLD